MVNLVFEVMNEEKAQEVLGDAINADNSIGPSFGHYIEWSPGDPEKAVLDSRFTADELEAVAWWMRNKGPAYKHNPDHEIGTCAKCGEEVVYNVPRLGPGGGFVHKKNGSFACHEVEWQGRVLVTVAE